MKKIAIILVVSLCCLQSVLAQNGTKMEAENAYYSNCKLINDKKYSGHTKPLSGENTPSMLVTMHFTDPRWST